MLLLKNVKLPDNNFVSFSKVGAYGAVQAGDELASDAEGRAVPAKSGDFIAGIALSSADKAGTWVTVQVTKSGYKAATAG